MKFKYYLILFVIILLSGCAGKQAPTISTPWPVQKEMASHLTEWRLDGKIAVRDKQQGHTARLTWYQNKQNFELMVSGPLGQGAIAIKSDGTLTSVATHQGEKQIQGDLSEYIAKHYGWTIPVESLRYWIRGIADPSSEFSEESDADGFPKIIHQAGWTITYDGYRAAQNMPLLLPAHLTIVREDYQLKVIVQNWTNLAIDKSS